MLVPPRRAEPRAPGVGVRSPSVVADRCKACVLRVCYVCVSVYVVPGRREAVLCWGRADPPEHRGCGLPSRGLSRKGPGPGSRRRAQEVPGRCPGGAGVPTPRGARLRGRGVPAGVRAAHGSWSSVGTQDKLWCPETAGLFGEGLGEGLGGASAGVQLEGGAGALWENLETVSLR